MNQAATTPHPTSQSQAGAAFWGEVHFVDALQGFFSLANITLHLAGTLPSKGDWVCAHATFHDNRWHALHVQTVARPVSQGADTKDAAPPAIAPQASDTSAATPKAAPAATAAPVAPPAAAKPVAAKRFDFGQSAPATKPAPAPASTPTASVTPAATVKPAPSKPSFSFAARPAVAAARPAAPQQSAARPAPAAPAATPAAPVRASGFQKAAALPADAAPAQAPVVTHPASPRGTFNGAKSQGDVLRSWGLTEPDLSSDIPF